MNLKQFKFRTTATLHDAVERGDTSRAAIEEAADTSKSRVQAWFTTEEAGGVRDNVRLPDAHDLHQLATNLPRVGRPLLQLVLDGTGACIQTGLACGKVGTLDDGMGHTIDHAEQAVAVVREYRAAIADRVITAEESARLLAKLDVAAMGMQQLRQLVSTHTARPASGHVRS